MRDVIVLCGLIRKQHVCSRAYVDSMLDVLWLMDEFHVESTFALIFLCPIV
jgi:hypothetical protein